MRQLLDRMKDLVTGTLPVTTTHDGMLKALAFRMMFDPAPPRQGKLRKRPRAAAFESIRHTARRERDASWRKGIRENGCPPVAPKFLSSAARQRLAAA